MYSSAGQNENRTNTANFEHGMRLGTAVDITLQSILGPEVSEVIPERSKGGTGQNRD